MVENFSVQDSLKPYLYAQEGGRPSKAEAPGASEKAEKVEKAEELEERRDEYIPDDEEKEKNAGLYHLEVDEEGKPKIVADDSAKPAKSDTPAEAEAESTADDGAKPAEAEAESAADDGAKPAEAEAESAADDGAKPAKSDTPAEAKKPEENEEAEKPEKPEKKKVQVGRAVVDDSAWQAEIAQITQKKAQISQQLSGAGDDEEKRKALEAKIAQIESELAAKSTDAYRKQRATARDMGSVMADAAELP